MRTSKIIPIKELGKAALLLDAVGSWAQIDPFVLHGPPQALDKDIVVEAPASVHADLDPVIPQHVGKGGSSLKIRCAPGKPDISWCPQQILINAFNVEYSVSPVDLQDFTYFRCQLLYGE